MSGNPKKLIQFWQELKRRKVFYFLIGYIAACAAIIEFFDITLSTFSIPQNTLRLLYILTATGLPVVIILPWITNRRRTESEAVESSSEVAVNKQKEKRPKHNLPAQLTNFIGREKEMEAVTDLIMQHRLVTLTGAGGCGKTRLACEVGTSVVKGYENGVWFIDLAPVTSVELVAKEISEILNIPEVPNQTIADTLLDRVRDLQMLIILDNCEHLLERCAELAGKMVGSAPELHILATSREALNVTGEKVWRIPSLSLIDPKKIMDIEYAKGSDAVLMFSDRARLNNPDFELVTNNVNDVVNICKKLDGIPLAIELVASRIRHMNPQMILERFEDRFDKLPSSDPGTSKRQQTLQATIEWSYNLLSTNEKLLFTRLAVFSGGFDIEAVEDICADDHLPKEQILDLHSKLVDRSMVTVIRCRDQSVRYSLLETLRHFALQYLNSADEEHQIRSRHLRYYLNLAEKSYLERMEFQQKWLKILDVEHDNMVSALNWSEEHSKNSFLRLSAALAWYWSIHSNFFLGISYLERALEIREADSEAYAVALFGLGMFMWFTGDLSRGISVLEDSLKLMHQFGRFSEEANILTELSRLYHTIGDDETGTKCSRQSLDLAMKIGDPGLINSCKSFVCMSNIFLKEYKIALPLVMDVIVASQNLKQPNVELTAYHFFCDCALGTEDFKEAEKRYAGNVERSLKYGNAVHATIELQGVAFSVGGQQRWAKAIRLNAAARENARFLGAGLPESVYFWNDWLNKYIGTAREKLGEELNSKYEEEGKAMGFEKAVEYALDFEKD